MRERRRTNILPGFGMSLGYALSYLSVLVLLPMCAVCATALGDGWESLWRTMTDARTLAAYRVSLGSAAVAAMANVAFGSIVAWVLVRYRFSGRGVLDALVDLPFALPTAVAGVALTALYAPEGALGRMLGSVGVEIGSTNAGIVAAMMLVSLPFAVRTLQPVLEDLDRDVEEAAEVLGASRPAVMMRVILPQLAPALLTGLALSFAKSIGEYGSIIFIAGNIPHRSEIAPVLIMTRLEEFEYSAAAGTALGLLGMSFVMLLTINALQTWVRRNAG